jgi:hypothetical protein
MLKRSCSQIIMCRLQHLGLILFIIKHLHKYLLQIANVKQDS